MKKIILTSLLSALMLCGIITTVSAQSKLEKRYTYTLKNLHLDKKTETQFAPVLKAYLTEKKKAGDIYDKLYLARIPESEEGAQEYLGLLAQWL